MIAVKELKRWLNTLGKDDFVYIDEGGLTLVSDNEGPEVYLEVGGNPEDEEGES